MSCGATSVFEVDDHEYLLRALCRVLQLEMVQVTPHSYFLRSRQDSGSFYTTLGKHDLDPGDWDIHDFNPRERKAFEEFVDNADLEGGLLTIGESDLAKCIEKNWAVTFYVTTSFEDKPVAFSETYDWTGECIDERNLIQVPDIVTERRLQYEQIGY